MGKYDKVLDNYPKIQRPFDDPGHQERVTKAMRDVEADVNFKRQASWLFAKYATLRRVKEDIQGELSECQVQLDAVERMMQTQFEVEGTGSLGLANGDKVRLEPGIYPKVTDKESFRVWCLEDPDLSKQMVLHSSTAQSLVRKMALAGEEPPPGCEIVVYDKVVFTQGE